MLQAYVLDHKGSWEEHLPLVEFAHNNSYQVSIQMAPYEALYGRPCRSPICWTEVVESSIISPDFIREASEKVSLIRQRLLTAYLDIEPLEILERVGTVAYQLALPPSMSGVHEVFHVSMLRKYTPDPTHVVDWGEITVDTYGTFEEGPL